MSMGAISNIVGEIEVETTLSIECSLCYMEEKDHYGDKVQFGKWLYKEGWRYDQSQILDCKGVMCPSCHPHKEDPKKLESFS